MRESVVGSGAADGEARRLADQARAECEGIGNGVPIDLSPDALCATDGEIRNAPPTGDDPKQVAVYFSCEADSASLGTDAQPVYRFMREIPPSLSGTLPGRVEGALLAYLAGPTPEETDRGYFAAAAPSVASTLAGVKVDGTEAIIDFSPALEKQLGNLGTSTATGVFLAELKATVFQFDEIDRIALRVDGDCERFWRLLESSCHEIERS